MSRLFTVDQKKELLKQIKIDARLNELWQDFCARVWEYTKEGVLEPMYESFPWWYYVFDRVGDASFVYTMTGDKTAGKYVYNCVMDICKNKTEDDWVGDWFRRRHVPDVSTLETSMITCSLVVAYEFCGDLFSTEEKELIIGLIKERSLPWGKRFLEVGFPWNNHKIVQLSGYAAAAFLLQDKEAIEYAVEYFNLFSGAFNRDSYGEGIQYSNYSVLRMIHAYEFITAYDDSLSEKLDTSFAANMMRWYASSFMYMKPMNDSNWGNAAYPRTINFGDSTAVFRPSGETLMHVAKYFAKDRPTEAGIAMWLFETTYKEKLDYRESASYGLGNDYNYLSLINYVSAKKVKPLSPKDAGLDLVEKFETGTVVYRNSWDNPELILGIQGGYKLNNMTGHRHLDQNSFILAYHNERMLADPGHTCYRLSSRELATFAESHNTWTFEKENGEILTQTKVLNNVLFSEEQLGHPIQLPMNDLKRCEMKDNLFICQSDCAKAYGEDVEKALRTWVVLANNIVIVFDRIKTKVPLKLITHFVVNNRGDKTDERIFYKKRVVMRRNGVGMKLIPLEPYDNTVSMKRCWSYMHDIYSPVPNSRGQGKEGSALVYDYKADEYAQNHVAAYAIVLDNDKDIRLWHVKGEDKNSYYISKSTDAEKGFRLVFKEDGALSITDLSKNKNYEIN